MAREAITAKGSPGARGQPERRSKRTGCGGHCPLAPVPTCRGAAQGTRAPGADTTAPGADEQGQRGTGDRACAQGWRRSHSVPQHWGPPPPQPRSGPPSCGQLLPECRAGVRAPHSCLSLVQMAAGALLARPSSPSPWSCPNFSRPPPAGRVTSPDDVTTAASFSQAKCPGPPPPNPRGGRQA